MKNFLLRNRYKIAIFGLMTVASAICVFLVAARIAYSDSIRYTNLVWNLFLAWIPFVLAYLAYTLSWKKWLLYFVIPVTTFLWLIFFPNAPYILTDLQHLAKESTSAPLWYDVIVMVWFSWTGLLLGLVSLYLMHYIIQRMFGRAAGWAFVFIVSGLSSFGVYLGRFVRFNSWDLLNDPKEIVVTILGLAIDPSMRVIAFTILFAVFYLFVYLTLYSFAHLVREDPVAALASH
ncbi:MAG TPA: DUF1361 domain-containing protein [Anaerolineales bacterium]|nr:DUF1361 domain-containing protein [Anaerolineales bacterium]HMV97012.1 DUF1361 domain-containing protein [Anaerolineales bacterium]HMX20532.1 DUF1361 domain-containing protein [Anaerolineales bacterium]HMX74348.1 DUF1361 domain-containing protein [Anaerolineales bacterium]HMZ44279.1 DUF1361 domain-containing protein [Anaerolineales bacterium]